MEIFPYEEDKLLKAAQEIAPWLHGELVYELDSIDKGYYKNLISRNLHLTQFAVPKTGPVWMIKAGSETSTKEKLS